MDFETTEQDIKIGFNIRSRDYGCATNTLCITIGLKHYDLDKDSAEELIKFLNLSKEVWYVKVKQSD